MERARFATEARHHLPPAAREMITSLLAKTGRWEIQFGTKKPQRLPLLQLYSNKLGAILKTK